MIVLETAIQKVKALQTQTYVLREPIITFAHISFEVVLVIASKGSEASKHLKEYNS